MTLELSQLTQSVRSMGQAMAERQRAYADLVDLARRWLAEFADQGPMLQHPAREVQAAIPTDEPLDADVSRNGGDPVSSDVSPPMS